MSSNVKYTGNIPAKIVKWKVKKGTDVQKRTTLCTYLPEGSTFIGNLKAGSVGTVKECLVQEGTTVKPGDDVLLLQGCTHPTVMKDLCALCGANLRDEFGKPGDRKENVSASVAMVHSVPELIVSEEEAKKIGNEDQDRLLRDRKLVLLVDLDQTLLHTTRDNIPANLKDVHHFTMPHGPMVFWYHTKFRPGIDRFLENISKMYELHICTFGVRLYAHSIAKILDPEGQYFSHRILSRDECFNPTSKTANLKALFPCGDSMVAIIDDREDVWNYSPNLIHVKPYQFFYGTADINAPPGMTNSDGESTVKSDKNRESRIIKVPRKKKNADKDSNDKNSDAGRMEKEGKKDEQKESDTNDVEMTDKQNTKTDKQEKEVEKDTDNSKENLSESSKSDKTDLNSDDKCANKDSDSKECTKENNINDDSLQESEAVGEIKDNSVNSAEKENNVGEGSTNTEAACEKSPKEEGECDTMSDDSTECDKDKNGSKGTSDKKDKASDEMEYDEMIEWNDPDDYLLHLEEILTRIHRAFYEFYDQSQKRNDKELPSLKTIIPYVKRKTLQGANVVFSGLPHNRPIEQTRKFILAESLGANIQTEGNIVPPNGKNEDVATTHVVATRPGTQKIRTALKHKSLFVVNSEWLFTCGERWEKVNERLYTEIKEPTQEELRQDLIIVPRGKRKSEDEFPDELNQGKDAKIQRLEPENNSAINKERDVEKPSTSKENAGGEKNAGNGDNAESVEKRRFSDSYNPILAFSQDALDDMDKEVAEMMVDESSDSEEEQEKAEKKLRSKVLVALSKEDSSSEDSLSGGNFPRGWKKKGKKSKDDEAKQDDEEGVLDDDLQIPDQPHRIMRHSSDSDSSAQSDKESFEDSVGSVDEEMLAEVEKQLLGV